MREVSGVWIFSVIYNFLGDSLGQGPYAGLGADSAGNLYGTTNTGGSLNLGETFKLTLGTNNSWTETVIHSFEGYAKKDGAYPDYAGVTLDADRECLRQHLSWWIKCANNLNDGTVYKLAASTYKESVLWSFGTSGDGYYPEPRTDSRQWKGLWYDLCWGSPWRGSRV